MILTIPHGPAFPATRPPFVIHGAALGPVGGAIVSARWVDGFPTVVGFSRAVELRLGMDTFGLKPKGRQDRRWLPPREDKRAAASTARAVDPYAHLRVVIDDS